MKWMMIWAWLNIQGTVCPMEEYHMGQPLYELELEDGTVYTEVYMEEILEWYDTKTFEYNEDLVLTKNKYNEWQYSD